MRERPSAPSSSQSLKAPCTCRVQQPARASANGGSRRAERALRAGDHAIPNHVSHASTSMRLRLVLSQLAGAPPPACAFRRNGLCCPVTPALSVTRAHWCAPSLAQSVSVRIAVVTAHQDTAGFLCFPQQYVVRIPRQPARARVRLSRSPSAPTSKSSARRASCAASPSDTRSRAAAEDGHTRGVLQRRQRAAAARRGTRSARCAAAAFGRAS
jgi:hypothetical protein